MKFLAISLTMGKRLKIMKKIDWMKTMETIDWMKTMEIIKTIDWVDWMNWMHWIHEYVFVDFIKTLSHFSLSTLS